MKKSYRCIRARALPAARAVRYIFLQKGCHCHPLIRRRLRVSKSHTHGRGGAQAPSTSGINIYRMTSPALKFKVKNQL
jgi:hypothetical protein